MRLSSLEPTVSSEVATILENSGIRTDTDIIFTPPLEIFQRLPPGSMTLQELTKLRTAVIEFVSPESALASELLFQESGDDGVELCVGNEGIDELLRGLGGRRVIEISGDRASGKTALTLNIVLNHLTSRAQDTVAWIDVLGDFTPANAYAILEAKGNQEPDVILDRLQVSLTFDTDAFYAVLDELSSNAIRPRIIVVDAITPLLGPLLSGVSAHGHAIMTDLMRRLRAFSKAHGATILVINNATLKHGFDATKPVEQLEKKPALGPSFTFMTDTTLWLSSQKKDPSDPNASSPTFHLSILKSRNKASGLARSFSLDQGLYVAS
ncbi:P-loop containing nucleoside triphosphate hydrolase protein [Coprinopsis marcescibilis]|uniref:P-loop containing nucleoside triphosphate hydrolase protein n=1 Tax=Coprinopsis marcescibilis TaxID=230819 RepID=A0A5C3L4N8_COPMA|nr:P-loop containing nucleoside triphosphate hydrolase protein [Coprinopsis marcescibilis]